MDAQHQKTNKSAQFACYLREHTYIIEYYILHLSFRAAVSPPSSICSPYTAHSSRTTQASKQATKRGRKFLGTTFFLCFFLVTETKGYDKNYLPTCLTLSRTGDCEPPNRELRLGNQTKPLCVITQKWSMHAIICDIQFAHGVNLPIFLVTLFSFFSLFFLSFFFFVFSFYLFLFAHISKCPRHGWRFRYVCF